MTISFYATFQNVTYQGYFQEFFAEKVDFDEELILKIYFFNDEPSVCEYSHYYYFLSEKNGVKTLKRFNNQVNWFDSLFIIRN